MFIRYVFFKVKFIHDIEKKLHFFWEYNLVPSLNSFPNLLRRRVICKVDSDDLEDPFPLVIAIKFSSPGKIDEVLSSSTSWKSKEASKKQINMFEGTVIHTILDTKQFNAL